jgi:hypothetical protein
LVFVPVTHDLVQAATVNQARQAAHVLDEVTEELAGWRKFRMVDVAVQGLIQSIRELGHTLLS